MHWQQTLIDSSLWIAKAYMATLIVGFIVSRLVIRFTRWGKQFWQLASRYFSPKRSWRPLIVAGIILLLTLTGVRLDVLFSNWYNTMYDTLQAFNASGFWVAMIIFSVLATAHVIRSLLNFFVQQAFIIHWRQWLNEHLLSRWMKDQAYYRALSLSHMADNPDQRIQQDITSFTNESVNLAMGAISAMVSTVAFTVILWNLSGPMDIWGYTIPRAMVFLVFLYVLVVTFIAIWIGRPLIQLNFLNEKLNASYRYALIRLREYAESVAFYRGEQVEGHALRHAFAYVIGNAWDIIYRSLKFMGFNFVASQAAVVFPLIIQAGRFFSKQIKLGDLMQTAQAFGQLQNNLSFFRNAYDSFAAYRATLDRLTGFNDTLDAAHTTTLPDISEQGSRLALESVTVNRPDGNILIDDISLEIPAQCSLLIRGPSGAGKTTLLRTIAGIWPHSSGHIIRPQTDSLFLPQKPYLPMGSLRRALNYPHSTDSTINNHIVLEKVQLGHLCNHLDQEQDWSRILSLGEQQRLAFGRLLITKPEVAFLDEATSAMDEGLEDAMYRLLAEHLPQMRIVSIGHRRTLRRFHNMELILTGEHGAWRIETS